MDFPKISMVIPSYNQGQFLEETIRSVIDQQYPNLELFVVDGGSSDTSIDVIKKYEKHITWWVSEKDKGQSDAIIKGFKKTTGEIVSWLCSDDLLVKGALSAVSSGFSSADPNISLLHGGATVFDGGKTNVTLFNYQSPGKEAYLSGMVFPQPAAFFRKTYLEQVGGINDLFHYGMDYDLYMRLSLISEFKPIDTVLAKYRLHDQSKSVVDSSRFIYDWKRSFVALCKNLSWNDELDFLKKTGLFENELDFSNSFTFKPEESIVSRINRKRVLFFHLGHVLKDLYWNYRIDEAKKLLALLRKNFPGDWIEEDSRLKAIVTKLNAPALALKSIRFIKRMFK